MNGSQKVPVPTLARLATYYSVLKEAEEAGVASLNSAKIEGLCGIAATQIRKDLSRFGELGKPGVGYEVAPLRRHIEKILNLDRVQKVAIIGAGRDHRRRFGAECLSCTLMARTINTSSPSTRRTDRRFGRRIARSIFVI